MFLCPFIGFLQTEQHGIALHVATLDSALATRSCSRTSDTEKLIQNT